MKLNSINSTTNYDNRQVRNNNRKTNTNFKGLADIPGVLMQGIENGGFATSFIVQDTLGMTVPRTWEGLNRGVEKKEEDKDKKGNIFTRMKNFFKNFSLKNMNLKEGAEVFLREALSGPLLMFTPMLVLLGAKKFVGKSTFTNSSLINRLGNALTNTVKNASHDSTKALKTAFYKDSVTSAVRSTTNLADKVAESKFVDNITKELETLDAYSNQAGKSKLRKKAVKRQRAKIVEMFNDYHTANNPDYSMVNKVKYKDQTYSTGEFIDGLTGYADDALKNKNISEINEQFTESFKKKSLVKRGITNIAAALSAIGAVSIVPKLYTLINPVPPGAINTVETKPEPAQVGSQQQAQPQANNNVQNNNGSKVAFKGKWDKLARSLEFNGNNFTPVLMTTLATGGLLGPRISTAVKRAPQDPVTKEKDYSEIPEILTRDIVSTGAVTFGVPMISKALVSSYEKASGFVLQNHPDKEIKGFKKVLDMLNPLSGIAPYNLNDLNSIYSKVDSKEKLSTFGQYIDKNNGSLAKIFNVMDNGKKVFEEHGLNLKDLASQKDRKAANKQIMDLANSSEEFAGKLINLLAPTKKGGANKIVKRAKTLNSITSFAATVALVPAFLGIVLPRIVYAQTARRQKQKSMAQVATGTIDSPAQQVTMKSSHIDYSKLKMNTSSAFDSMKQH